MKNVLLPQPIEPDAIKLLDQEGCTIVTADEPKHETVLPLIHDAHALVLRTGISITRELLAAADDLLVISRTGGGLDNVDLAAATEKGIIVTSNLGINTISVTEHVLSMMLALAKKLYVMDRAVRRGNFKIRYQNLPKDLHGKTLGLVGFGRIGSEIGRICQQVLGMRILAYDPHMPEKRKEEFHSLVNFTTLNELLENSDIVSIHVPLTDQSCNLLGEFEISRMKKDALLINASRGGVVDEAALCIALQNHVIAGAGLDVFSEEPVPVDNALLKLENVILTPHSAALTKECVTRMATEAARCVLDVFTGRVPANVANPETLKTERWKHLQA